MNKKQFASLALIALSISTALPAFAESTAPLLMEYGVGSISNFMVEKPQYLRSGNRIFFTMQAERGSRAQVHIETSHLTRIVNLSETSPGYFEGFYTVKPNEEIHHPSFRATAERRGRVSEAWARDETGDFRSAQPTAPEWRQNAPEWRQPAPAVLCPNCGVITSIREVDENSDEANAAGLIIGGLVGGGLGNQVGGGRGKDAATILGLIGGAAIGNEIAKNQNKRHIWLIAVSLDNGTTQTFKNTTPPQAAQGQRVRVENNQLFPERR